MEVTRFYLRRIAIRRSSRKRLFKKTFRKGQPKGSQMISLKANKEIGKLSSILTVQQCPLRSHAKTVLREGKVRHGSNGRLRKSMAMKLLVAKKAATL
jgi:hypothetical protein